MSCLARIVISAVLLCPAEQFLFPDKLKHSWTRKLIPHNKNRNSVKTSNTDRKEVRSSNLCKNGLEYCMDPDAYPSQAIARALEKQSTAINSMFDKSLPIIEARSGLDTFHLENVCGAIRTDIKPRAAKNKKGEFKFLVNGGEGAEDFIQLVQITKCQGAGESCGRGNIFHRESTICKQEYSDHKLVALDENGEELVVDTFSFPSCCSCYMHKGLEM